MLNVVAIMGRLVADPELRTTPAGHSVCSFRIACDRSYVQQGQERQGEERQEAPPAAASARRGVGPVRSMGRRGHSTRLVIPCRCRGASAVPREAAVLSVDGWPAACAAGQTGYI